MKPNITKESVRSFTKNKLKMKNKNLKKEIKYLREHIEELHEDIDILQEENEELKKKVVYVYYQRNYRGHFVLCD